jgi:hypothetical protein
MSLFDEDINLKNLESIALFKQIRAIVDWIIDNLSQYHETVLYDVSPLSILRKNNVQIETASDAHKQSDVGANIPELENMLKD